MFRLCRSGYVPYSGGVLVVRVRRYAMRSLDYLRRSARTVWNLRQPTRLFPATALAVATGLAASIIFGLGDKKPHDTVDSTTAVYPSMGCRSDFGPSLAIITGGLQVANGSISTPRYRSHIEVTEGDLVTFQLWVQNREPARDLTNVRTRLRVPAPAPSAVLTVVGEACGSNTLAVSSAVTLSGHGLPFSLQFIPGSVKIRS